MIQDMNKLNMVDEILKDISALSTKEIREIFIRMWRHMDALNNGLKADNDRNICIIAAWNV